ncbi:MAG: prepilin-type N-terminal cleavage/methylation domain-containing protein [Armatimonadetes bacterium]|nr:prepilin-type N-terminal cleavage/methylation domain-containing protein [Armatimonadota bacterium]
MKKAFTLIELLVVIAIIAILAAILFPVFTQAKLAAKKTQDLSNMKQIGTGIALYLGDSDDTYPQAYWYPNDSGSTATSGYVQWSGATMPYIKSRQIFVSPNDKLQGMAPTNFRVSTNNDGAGIPAGQTSAADIQDVQAPRLSYTANAALMPRKRKSVDPANTVSQTSVEGVSSTILLAPLTDVVPCINDSSAASGTAFKSHRPANAFLVVDNGAPFIGEAAAEYTQAGYWAVSPARVKADIASCTAGSPAATQTHMRYTSPLRFGNGANYTFADTSAKFQPLERTLDPSKFLWGTYAYSAGGKPIYKPGTTVQVN